MTSRRNLKKDIDYLTFEVVGYCLGYLENHPKANEEEAFKMIQDAIHLRNELVARSNHPDGKDNPKLVKAHYKKIVDELVTGCDNTFEKLEKLLEEKEA